MLKEGGLSPFPQEILIDCPHRPSCLVRETVKVLVDFLHVDWNPEVAEVVFRLFVVSLCHLEGDDAQTQFHQHDVGVGLDFDFHSEFLRFFFQKFVVFLK